MRSAGKGHTKRRNRHSRRWIFIAVATILIATLPTAAYLVYSQNGKENKDSNSAINNNPAFTAFTEHYLTLMKSLNSTQTKTAMASQLKSNYNQTDLFSWQQTKMVFSSDTTWSEDPIQILNFGDGICVQWSIVYVSACLALGYQSRIVVAADTTNWNFIHTWAEDYYNGSWVHVDPSDKVWNNPSHYSGWDWGKDIGSSVRIYAFEDGSFQDVTSTYG